MRRCHGALMGEPLEGGFLSHVPNLQRMRVMGSHDALDRQRAFGIVNLGYESDTESYESSSHHYAEPDLIMSLERPPPIQRYLYDLNYQSVDPINLNYHTNHFDTINMNYQPHSIDSRTYDYPPVSFDSRNMQYDMQYHPDSVDSINLNYYRNSLDSRNMNYHTPDPYDSGRNSLYNYHDPSLERHYEPLEFYDLDYYDSSLNSHYSSLTSKQSILTSISDILTPPPGIIHRPTHFATIHDEDSYLHVTYDLRHPMYCSPACLQYCPGVHHRCNGCGASPTSPKGYSVYWNCAFYV